MGKPTPEETQAPMYRFASRRRWVGWMICIGFIGCFVWFWFKDEPLADTRLFQPIVSELPDEENPMVQIDAWLRSRKDLILPLDLRSGRRWNDAEVSAALKEREDVLSKWREITQLVERPWKGNTKTLLNRERFFVDLHWWKLAEIIHLQRSSLLKQNDPAVLDNIEASIKVAASLAKSEGGQGIIIASRTLAGRAASDLRKWMNQTDFQSWSATDFIAWADKFRSTEISPTDEVNVGRIYFHQFAKELPGPHAKSFLGVSLSRRDLIQFRRNATLNLCLAWMQQFEQALLSEDVAVHKAINEEWWMRFERSSWWKVLAPNKDGEFVTRFFTDQFRSRGALLHRARSRLCQALFLAEAHKRLLGHWPETGERLAPEVAERWPVDPYDGKPIKALRSLEIVYSVGEDLIDGRGRGADEFFEYSHDRYSDDETMFSPWGKQMMEANRKAEKKAKKGKR